MYVYTICVSTHIIDIDIDMRTELDAGLVELSEGEIDALNACVVAIYLQATNLQH